MQVVVVGGGLAGCWAAVTAAEQGAQVTLVSRAPGATALYAGAMEIAPDLEEVMMTEPYHPYRRLYRDHLRLAADLETVTQEFKARLGRVGFRLAGAWNREGRFPDLYGGVRRGQLVPASVEPGEVDGLRGKRVAVVGVEGIGEYDAEAIAAGLNELGLKVSPVSVQLKELPAGAALADLYDRLPPAVRTTAEVVAYPPGFASLPDKAFELLAAPPSPHGWRLHKALEKAVDAAGVDVVRAEVTGFERDGGRLTAALVTGRRLAASAFVLASGRFIGGGMQKARLVSEPLLDLAVYYQGETIQAAYPRVRHLEYVNPEAAFRTGLLTDAECRPVDDLGRPAFENLYAAGSVLGGYDYGGGGCGFGVPLLTGRLAGLQAAAKRA